jgi:purine-binding chemotaxis protein CheW
MTDTYLSFTICNDFYAVEIKKVIEVLEKTELTKVPNAPQVIQGIINFRGYIVPIYESRIKFNLPPREPDEPYYIVVVELFIDEVTYYVGAIVDKVYDVLDLDDSQISPVPPMSKEFNPEFIKGVAKLENHFLMLLDVDKIYSSSEKEDIKLISHETSHE